jgi:hypothetical protein
MAEAVEALYRLTSKEALSARDRANVVATVVAWIEDRERQVRDIELGATRLLLQAAEEVGRYRSVENNTFVEVIQ